MAISRTLTLTARLEGVDQVLRSLELIKKSAVQLQGIIGSIGFNGIVTNGSKLTSFEGDRLGIRFIVPELDGLINQMTARAPKIRNAMQQVNNAIINSEGIRKSIREDPFAFKRSLIRNQDLANYASQAANFDFPGRQSRISETAAMKYQAENYAADERIRQAFKNIPSTLDTETNRLFVGEFGSDKLNNLFTEIRDNLPKTYREAFDKVIVSAKDQNTKLGSLTKQYVNSAGLEQKKLTEQIITEVNSRTAAVKKGLDEELAATKKTSELATEYLKTAFGMHIAQMYLSPVVNQMQEMTKQMFTTYADFDKEYARYAAMSKNFKNTFSKQQFAEMAVGKVYTITDLVTASEKFAASGVDIAESQDALTAVMQTATSANMDYGETAYGVVRTMQAMHMQIDQTREITDAMASAANNSTAELKDLVDWFQYAAGAAYSMGLNVKQLAGYLAVLSSTGTPGAGAAFRQMLIQLQQPDIQEKFLAKYSFLKPEDFKNIDQFIEKMRNYIQTSKDQKKAELDALEIFQGRANAQQAFGNLMMAQKPLWDQIKKAIAEGGSTLDLYNMITDNASANLQILKDDLQILATQFGQCLDLILPPVVYLVDKFTKWIVDMPDYEKKFIGVLLVLATVFASLFVITLAVAGAMFVLQANFLLMQATGLKLTLGFGGLLGSMKLFWIETLRAIGVLDILRARMIIFSATCKTTALSMLSFIRSMSGMNAALVGIGGAYVGYLIQNELMQNAMYDEARIVAHLTSLWIGYATAKTLGMTGIAGVAVGLAAGGAYDIYAQTKINELEEQTKTQKVKPTSASANNYNTTNNKNYNLFIDNAVINPEGLPIDEYASEMAVGDY